MHPQPDRHPTSASPATAELQLRAVRTMLLTRCSAGEIEDSLRAVVEAALWHAAKLNADEALVIAADHLAAARAMTKALKTWRVSRPALSGHAGPL